MVVLKRLSLNLKLPSIETEPMYDSTDVGIVPPENTYIFKCHFGIRAFPRRKVPAGYMLMVLGRRPGRCLSLWGLGSCDYCMGRIALRTMKTVSRRRRTEYDRECWRC